LPAPAGAIVLEVGSKPRDVRAADFNLDGHLDAVVANSGDGSVMVLPGGPEGPFKHPGQTIPAIPAGQEPADIEAVDLDLDGDTDIVVANHGTSLLTVLVNDGRGGFTEAPYSPIDTGALPHVHGVVSGDFNADGWPDLAVDSADTREVRILHGSRRGFLPPIPVHLTTMPYFLLGKSDGPAGGASEILVPGQSDNTIVGVQYQGDHYDPSTLIDLGGTPWVVVSDDVNGDGQTDIVVIETDALSVWLATGDGFSPASGSPFAIPGATGVATGDLNGDLIPDIAVGPWDGDEVAVISGGDFSMQRVTACERPIGLAIGDLSGDSHPDLLVTCPTQDRVILLTFPPAP
jgi:hypothetical protein